MDDFKGYEMVDMTNVLRYEITREDLLHLLKLKTGDEKLFQDGIGIDKVSTENGTITIDIVENRLEAVKTEVINEIKDYGWKWETNWVKIMTLIRAADKNRFGYNHNTPTLHEIKEFAEKNIKPLF